MTMPDAGGFLKRLLTMMQTISSVAIRLGIDMKLMLVGM